MTNLTFRRPPAHRAGPPRRTIRVALDQHTDGFAAQLAAAAGTSPSVAVAVMIAAAYHREKEAKTAGATGPEFPAEDASMPLQRALAEIRKVPDRFTWRCAERQNINEPGCCGHFLRQIEGEARRLRRELFNTDDQPIEAMRKCAAMRAAGEMVAGLRLVTARRRAP